MRLIDADNLKKVFEGYSDTDFQNPYFPLDMVEKDIDNAPTVEAKEVVHGEWIEVKPRGYTHYSKGYAECSSCNEIVWSGWEMKFCPKCGCDMRTSAE